MRLEQCPTISETVLFSCCLWSKMEVRISKIFYLRLQFFIDYCTFDVEHGSQVNCITVHWCSVSKLWILIKLNKNLFEDSLIGCAYTEYDLPIACTASAGHRYTSDTVCLQTVRFLPNEPPFLSTSAHLLPIWKPYMLGEIFWNPISTVWAILQPLGQF